MRIAILGTRGIPNHYGGFEQFAEYFSVYLAQNGHEVFVYNSHNHPYRLSSYKGVSIIHKFDPEYTIGTAGQFIYDLNCILDAHRRNYDIILQLGYTSSSVWKDILPQKPLIITNMDGLEWKRTKYSKTVQKVLKRAEKWAVQSSDYLIADSIGIQQYLQEKYTKTAHYIAYGATQFNSPDTKVLHRYHVQPNQYHLLIARLEPENSIEIILDGVAKSNQPFPFLVIGNHQTRFGNYLKNKYKEVPTIQFLGAVYQLDDLNNLRYYSQLYFHGHTVGGTNPSLLEAMASQALIVAHNNDFNRYILKENAFYFHTALEVKNILDTIEKNDNLQKVQNNFEAIQSEFNWDVINGKYLRFFEECLSRHTKGNKK